MGIVWPLTGREEERRFIDRALRRADGPRGLVLAGAAGVGKTRLARETLAAASARGISTRLAVGTGSGRALSLGAFATLVGDVGADPAQVLPHAVAALCAGAGPAGLLVGVDDAHLLDDLSALLVHQLVLRRAATVVVTVRTGEPTPDAVTALWKDGHLDRLEVQPLSQSETTELLEAVLGGQLDSGSGRRAWELTRGNALFLRHLVDGELAAGRLREANGVWRWAGDPAMSGKLTELIETRMGEIPEPERDVADLLALAEPLDTKVLAQLTDAAAVERAEARGVVQVEGDGARLAHPLYGETRRAAIGQFRTRRLRGEIATALADPDGQDDGNTLRRAVLTLESDLEPDAGLFTAAARCAASLTNLRLAERLARAAVAAGGGFEPQFTLANAASFLVRGEETDNELRRLRELARTDAERVAAIWCDASNLFWTLGRPADAITVLGDALPTVTDDDAQRVLSSMRASFEACLGWPREAVDTAADRLASTTLPDYAIAGATGGLVIGLGVLGRADALEEAATRGHGAAARSIDVSFLRFPLAQGHIIGLRLAGYLDAAQRVAFDHIEQASNIPGPAQVFGASLAGQTAVATGRVRTAVRLLRQARARLAPLQTNGHTFICLLCLTHALAMTGEATASREMLAETVAKRHPSFAFLDPEIVLARAWVAAAEGAVSEAITLANEAATVAANCGQPAHEVLALHTAVCFGDRGAGERLGELSTLVDGPRAPAAAAHAAALAADDAVGLRAASEQLEHMGDLLAAADAAAQAAITFARYGRSGSATAAGARAQRLADACESARTPALLAAARPLPLTEREREIATLAAQGLSNREISDRLVVSVRTVEGHLYRAGIKLGTTTRSELAAVLHGR